MSTASDKISFLKSLRAIREFTPQPIPDDVIDDVLEVARWSGSAVNRQPWEFIVIRDKDTLKKLATVEGHARHLAGAATGIVLVMAGESFEHETYDEGRLAERIMLAAWAHGVGGCIGWFGENGRSEVKATLGIPDNKFVRTAISLGYPDYEARKNRPRREQPRKPLSEIVHWERYGQHNR